MKKSRVTIYLYLFLFLVVAFIFYIDKDRHLEETKKITTEEVDTSIYEKETKTIKKYENYITPIFMFREKKTTFKDLTDEEKNYIVLAYLDKDGFFENKTYYQVYDNEGNELKKPKKISEKKYDENRKDMIVYDEISSKEINKIANKIFNKDIQISNKITYNHRTICNFEDKLKCHYDPIDWIVDEDYIIYVSSDYTNDEIHIYQKYLHQTFLSGVIGTHNGVDSVDLDKESLKEITNGVVNKYGTTYKTTFKKDSDGQFYWYSSEPIEKNTK